MTTATSIFAPVEKDLSILIDNLTSLVEAQHPILGAAAEHLFTAGGKRIRPAIVLLVSRATMKGEDLTPKHRRLAEITEMIHTASLVHDDVVDEAELRRQVATVNTLFGNRVAVLAGDFLFAQSSWYLANLDNLQVVKLLSEVIRDFAEGEIQQGLSCFDTDVTLETYLQKSYFKTASLIANSAKAAAVLSGEKEDITNKIYSYGRNLGLAFQIVDDIIDFTSSTEILGKPAGSDLASGNLTAPVLYAMEEKPAISMLIEREFSEAGDLEQALNLIHESSGIEKARQLAFHHSQLALQDLQCLSSSLAKDSLAELTNYVIHRIK